MIKHIIYQFLNDESAQSTVEYVLIASALAIAGYGAIRMFGKTFSASFKSISKSRTGVLGTGP